jgi:hypothetical protein
MTIREASAKIDIRLNKGASGDYDNLWDYQKKEAFNKAVLEWVRRQKRGKNATQEGDEETDTRVDDLQVLLKKERLIIRQKDNFVETERIPEDYLFYKRLDVTAEKDNCQLPLTSYLREEANVNMLRHIPSFKFEETFHTISTNKIKAYHFKQFDIKKVDLIYYRLPKKYDFRKLDQVIEFKDDVCELIVDEACKIIASDIESVNQKILAQERAEFNN